MIESGSISSHFITHTTISDHSDDESPYLLHVSGHKQKETSVHIDHLNVTNNKIGSYSSSDMKYVVDAIVSFVKVEFYGSNMTFTHNSILTPLSFTSVHGIVSGHNVFEQNQAKYGGAIAILDADDDSSVPQVINTTVDTEVWFINNYADYGGAVYIVYAVIERCRKLPRVNCIQAQPCQSCRTIIIRLQFHSPCKGYSMLYKAEFDYQ